MILTVCTGPLMPVPTVRGGSGTRVWHGLAREFAKLGHRVTLLSRAFPGQPKREVLDAVHIERFGGFDQSRSILWDLARDLLYATRLAARLPPADILVINDFWLPPLAMIRPGAGRRVLSVHRYPKGQFFLYRGVHRIASPSTAIAEAIAAQARWARARTRVFPNAIDLAAFGPRRDRQPGSRVLLFVGRIHPEKGLDNLIAAFRLVSARFPDAVLRIVGPHAPSQGGGGIGYLERLRAAATGLPVEFLEPVFDTERLAEIYRKGDIFCYPSLAERGEAFPVAPLEAMATGLVPVVSGLACFRDLIEPGVSGFSFDHRADAAARLAEIASALVAEPARLEQARQEALRRAGFFSIERVASMYLADFKELVRGDGAVRT